MQRPANIQQQLFPQTVKLSPNDASLAEDLIDDIAKLGFIMEPFGYSTFIVTGLPAEFTDQNIQQLIEGVLENFKLNKSNLNIDKINNLARAMAVNLSIKPNKVLSMEEMQSLVDDLFACEVPGVSPSGKPVIVNISAEEIERRFGQTQL